LGPKGNHDGVAGTTQPDRGRITQRRRLGQRHGRKVMCDLWQDRAMRDNTVCGPDPPEKALAFLAPEPAARPVDPGDVEPVEEATLGGGLPGETPEREVGVPTEELAPALV